MQLVSLTPNNFQHAVELAAETIAAGSTIVIPTDTVYGIAANAFDEKAVQKVYQLKARDASKPLPIFVKNIGMAKKIARIGLKNQKLLEEYWPGKITAILKKTNTCQTYGTAGNTIALRIPFYPFVNSLLETLNLPITGTSANLSGQPASIKIDEVLAQFQNKPVKPTLVINAGDLDPARPSKIIDLTGDKPKVLRD